jgi:hypothetical protein
VPGHEGIAGNELADQLARTGSEYPFTGPEPTCSISFGAAKKAVRNWLNRKHIKQWESITGLVPLVPRMAKSQEIFQLTALCHIANRVQA